ncbi:MAG: energy-coupling factor transporter ATPase [Flexilinea sp.]
MNIIEAKSLFYSYEGQNSSSFSLNNVDFSIEPGEFVVILGHNGSGKSTLVKHFNALIPLQKGTLHIAGMDALDPANTWNIRRECGMVFQNPDNQFVSSVVEEDIAFGLENYETPFEQIAPKVNKALELVDMRGFEKRSPHMLSGGQKQRIALAGVLAMSPDIIVFDESTAMLDMEGRREVMETIERLHREEQKTIILITHFMEEAVNADRIYLMKEGSVLSEGTPRRILTDTDLLAGADLLPPLPVKVYEDLRKAGVNLGQCPLTIEELTDQLCRLL